MGGGPSAAQTNAANAQTDLTKELTNVFGKQQAFQQAQQEKANPFYSSLMQNGLPYIFALQERNSNSNLGSRETRCLPGLRLPRE
jgi:hypothetical protein